MGNSDKKWGLKGLFERAASGAAALALAAAVFAPAAQAGTVQLQLRDSHTQHSRELQDLARRFNNERSDVKIVPMDPDWFQLNAALNNTNLLDRRKMAGVTGAYLEEKAGMSFSPDLTRRIFETLAQGIDYTYSFHRYEPDVRGVMQKTGSVCLLFPYSADKNGRDHVIDYLLGIGPQNGDLYRANLDRHLRVDMQMKFSSRHEIGHCFDRWYIEESLQMKEAGNAMSPAAKIIHAHKKELFPEIMAALLLAREGVDDIALERSDVRSAGNAIRGPRYYRMKSDEEINLPGGQNVGFVYAFHRGLEAAQFKIDHLGDRIRSMTLNEIAELAHTLTEENALGESEALGAMFLWHYVFDTAQLDERADLRLESRNNPGLDFRKAYAFAKDFRSRMNESIPRVLDFRNRDTSDVLSTLSFGFDGRLPARLIPPFGRDDVREIAVVRDELLTRAKQEPGKGIDALVAAYEHYKNELRDVIADGSKAPAKTQREARYELSVLTEALRLAVHEIKYGPAPTQEELERRVREQQEQQKNQGAPAPAIAQP